MRHKIAHLIGRFKYTIAANIDDFMFKHFGYFFGRRIQSNLLEATTANRSGKSRVKGEHENSILL